jgi:hypothetical protein
MAALKKLPIRIQSFEKLLAGGCLYVEKTKQIYDLIKQNSAYSEKRMITEWMSE